MTNDDLKRFYQTNAVPEKKVDFVRYDKSGKIQSKDPVNPTDVVTLQYFQQHVDNGSEGSLQYSSFTQNETAYPNIDFWKTNAEANGIGLGSLTIDEEDNVVDTIMGLIQSNSQTRLTSRNDNEESKRVYNDIIVNTNTITLTSEIKTDTAKQEIIISPTDTTLNGSSIVTKNTFAETFNYKGQWVSGNEVYTNDVEYVDTASTRIYYIALNDIASSTTSPMSDSTNWKELFEVPLMISTTATLLGNVTEYTISEAGTYIFLGDVGTLTITSTEDVTISILGILNTVTLPSTTNTVLIHAVGYAGTFDSRPQAVKNGSVLGQYNIGRIDLV